MKKKFWWFGAIGLSLLLVVGIVGVGIKAQYQYGELTHGSAYTAAKPQEIMVPASQEGILVDETALKTRLAELAKAQALGNLGIQISAADGRILLAKNDNLPLRPASTTKILSATAAIYALGLQDRIITKVYEVPGRPDAVVIKATGDVWLNQEAIEKLAEQIRAKGLNPHTVLVDTTAWSGETILEGWNEIDVDAGYVAPLEPIMLYGARIGDTTGDVPRSHTPAYDVAAALARALDAENMAVEAITIPAASAPVAEVNSPTLAQRIQEMMVDSDNVMAEAIGREVALSQGQPADSKGATAATLAVLAAHGFDTTGVILKDNSGLSVDNRITAGLLNNILGAAIKDPQLRPLIEALPVAHATGTLKNRFENTAGRGYVRAKTGTLDYTSALAGVVVGKSGQLYHFAMIANEADVAAARSALDALASALREA
ncbi:D-alanyl-D-alanine carboxypeptidase/D-alanyl-D-alanine endopeptidase [Corynebacterium caspium]|uniref:D-alanyl-D-alanine carboxypeptidase/D-alanyl-D-alanine endopeptidase n=1 Tax=Corynebacterium caspium TaxID=234828 RepID=UPI0003755930|nr:D-alanyl-D-alanine carboxypeptidase/D-alanyl-D-alanine-endopeptidase [Corynebacterium caspium]WKD58688.1 D-alanyl-D-alanine carboxypeptidase precursor [Corynebacterium caspium DSM 44850]